MRTLHAKYFDPAIRHRAAEGPLKDLHTPWTVMESWNRLMAVPWCPRLGLGWAPKRFLHSFWPYFYCEIVRYSPEFRRVSASNCNFAFAARCLFIFHSETVATDGQQTAWHERQRFCWNQQIEMMKGVLAMNREKHGIRPFTKYIAICWNLLWRWNYQALKGKNI